MQKVLEIVRNRVTPSKDEADDLKRIVTEFSDKVAKELKKRKVAALLSIGGSVGKGSWLPGLHDIDFFLRFDLKKYGEKSCEISNITESILKQFKPARLHGSRDYFQIKYKGFEIEVIPVLHIRSIKQAQNITDVSPMHVTWIKKKGAKLASDLRLAKQFAKAADTYGAESYISGFSGHVLEILTVHYGGFAKLVRAAAKWKEGVVIDIEKRHKSPQAAKEAINKDKRSGPLLVVDPIQPERNAAAALGKERFEKFQEACKSFLKNPSEKHFEEKEITIAELKQLAKRRLIFVLEATPEKGKLDVVGAKLLKQFEYIKKAFEYNEFTLLESGWYWSKIKPALFWFIVDRKALSNMKTLRGPLTYGPEDHISAFKRKYARRKVWREGYNYFASIPRQYTKPDQLMRSLLRGLSIKKIKV